MKKRLQNMTDKLSVKYAIISFLLFACNHKKVDIQKVDSTAIIIKIQTAKLDSIHAKKSKIPYTRTDSARNRYWR